MNEDISHGVISWLVCEQNKEMDASEPWCDFDGSWLGWCKAAQF